MLDWNKFTPYLKILSIALLISLTIALFSCIGYVWIDERWLLKLSLTSSLIGLVLRAFSRNELQNDDGSFKEKYSKDEE